MEEKVKKDVEAIVLEVAQKNGSAEGIDGISEDASLTEDLGLDSFSLAEITVRIEDSYGVDIFEEEIVETFGQIVEKVK